MLPTFKTIALIGRYKSRDVAVPLLFLARFLVNRGCDVLVEADTAHESGVDSYPIVDYEAIGRQADLAIVLGGDGSMLNAGRSLAASGVPLLGVNQGRLGFLTDIAFNCLTEKMTQILEGQYTIETRTLLEPHVSRQGEPVPTPLALNDVVVSKGSSGRLVEMIVHIDKEFVYDLRADGLIISTPTGSTAYALSSDGPIIQPNVPGLALVPICPQTLSNRPITVGDGCAIDITLKRGHDARLHSDGQPQFDLLEGDRITIRRAEHHVRLVHPPGYSYYAMLREKLHWSESLF
ncbi:MAG TPA: NAD kinase [Burkholderiales bacterium]